jgi:mxaC protein
MSGLEFAHPWWLLALAAAPLPLLRRRDDERACGWNALLPADPVGLWRERLEKAIAALGIIALTLGLAGIGMPEATVKRQGSGAEIMVLLDRSASMDAALVPRGQRPGVDKYQEPKKRKIARRALAEFARGRPHDVFALTMFSVNQFQVLPFNSQPEMVQAAIEAGGVGSGLGDTDIGSAMLGAIARFDSRPANGNRIIMLVSDGGAPLTPHARQEIAANLKRNRITLYWIYLRSFNQPPLAESGDSAWDHSVEVAMHRYFSSLSTPYVAFEAESPEAMSKAIETLSRQQMMPITYEARLPRVDGSWLAYLSAAACFGLLLVLRMQHLSAPEGSS